MRDDRSIKQIEIKNIAMAQWVIGLRENNDEHKFFLWGKFLDLWDEYEITQTRRGM
jgi:hypothetical protein